MTVFLLPDGRPFYGGTYFPPEARGGLPSFRQVLEGIADGLPRAPRRRRAPGGRDGREPAGGPARAPARGLPADARRRSWTRCSTLRGQHDERNGGFGRAPKFPPHAVLTFLLRTHRRSGSEEALAMALRTLRRMADGGIRDQLGGGFHRYAVDAIWLVPHFEQMLYDNALLARAYLGGLAGDGRRAVAGGRRGRARLPAARARARARRLRLRAGRRHRRRRGRDVHLDARAAARGARRRGRRARRAHAGA